VATLEENLARRFGETVPSVDVAEPPDVWRTLAARGSVRSFKSEAIEPGVIRHLAAIALCAPTKSDLQQRDIIHVTDPERRAALLALVADQQWTTGIPTLLVFCGNNRRQRQVHDMRGHPFVNDHVDAMFNAAVDAGVALSAFVIAAEAVGLGCCPISAVRNHPEQVSDILRLPMYTFPVAGLAVGWPVEAPTVTPRLPLSAIFHENTFSDDGIVDTIEQYDARREQCHPYAAQRNTNRFGNAEHYGWSEDKARQYAEPERTQFGAYLRNQGFRLD